MKKCVYVLIGNEHNFYCEQFLVSVTSLKHYNPDAIVVLLTDSVTREYLYDHFYEVKDLVDNVVVQEFETSVSDKVRSRLLKTSLALLVAPPFLFLDCDTIICGNISYENLLKYDMCAVLDTHVLLDAHNLKDEFVYRANVMGWHASIQGRHYNSGIILVNNTERVLNFFTEWNALYKESLTKNIDADQVSFNEVNFRFNNLIVELDGVWNCQDGFGIQFISEAKIIHYLGFQTNEGAGLPKLTYKLANRFFFEKIKECGCINDEVWKIINNPRCFYNESMSIACDDVRYILINSMHMKLYKTIYLKFRIIWKLNEKILFKMRMWKKRLATKRWQKNDLGQMNK